MAHRPFASCVVLCLCLLLLQAGAQQPGWNNRLRQQRQGGSNLSPGRLAPDSFIEQTTNQNGYNVLRNPVRSRPAPEPRIYRHLDNYDSISSSSSLDSSSSLSASSLRPMPTATLLEQSAQAREDPVDQQQQPPLPPQDQGQQDPQQQPQDVPADQAQPNPYDSSTYPNPTAPVPTDNMYNTPDNSNNNNDNNNNNNNDNTNNDNNNNNDQQQQQQQPQPQQEEGPMIAPFNPTSSQNALTQYESFLQRNIRFGANLENLFNQFDTNHDGHLDSAELTALEQSNKLSPVQIAMLRSWDINHDGVISAREFHLGPLFLSMLELVPEKRDEYYNLLETGGDISHYKDMFTRVANGEAHDPMRFAQSHFSFGLSGGLSIGGGGFSAGASAHVSSGGFSASAGLSVGNKPAPAPAPKPTPAPAKPSAPAPKPMTPPPAKPEPPEPERPVSRFGIPTFDDEKCVVCQFVVQRIQYEIFHTLAGEDDQFPSDPNEPIDPSEMRKVNARLLNKHGGKGLLRIIAEDVVADMCDADNMPELFYPQCEELDKNFPTMLDAIFYQFNAQAVCQEAQFCTAWSYFNDNTAVHLPIQSKIFNTGRGRCGLMGGAHERPEGAFSAAICFAQKMTVK